MPQHTVRVIEIGGTARRIVDQASSAVVVAALSRSLYLDVGGELVWLGPPGSTLHGRTIVAPTRPAADAGTRVDVTFDLRAARAWHPAARPAAVSAESVRHAARGLAGAIGRLGPPDGFGALLVGRRPAFPLDRASDDARRLLAACARDDPATAAGLAERLLGLGPGLTPAGDDLIGGAWFAATIRSDPAPPWREATAAIRARAAVRTHRISAALLGDLLDGEGYAPLHQLAVALARAEAGAALDAATGLIGIGHSSGWDLLTGLLGALDALPGEDSMARPLQRFP